MSIVATMGISATAELLLDKVVRSIIDEGHAVDIVFLDIAKAFDKVPHQRLLEKLRKHGMGFIYYKSSAVAEMDDSAWPQ